MQNKSIRRSTVNPSDSASRLQPFLPVVELHFGIQFTVPVTSAAVDCGYFQKFFITQK